MVHAVLLVLVTEGFMAAVPLAGAFLGAVVAVKVITFLRKAF